MMGLHNGCIDGLAGELTPARRRKLINTVGNKNAESLAGGGNAEVLQLRIGLSYGVAINAQLLSEVTDAGQLVALAGSAACHGSLHLLYDLQVGGLSRFMVDLD